MNHGPLTLPVQGIDRTLWWRDTASFGTLPRDVVFWLHGGGQDPQRFLNQKVQPEADRIDVCPGGLAALDPLVSSTWGIPGQLDRNPFLPAVMSSANGGTVGKFHDLRFLCTAADYLCNDATFRAAVDPSFARQVGYRWVPDQGRFWLAGFSRGGALTIAAYAFNRTTQPGLGYLGLFRGYFISSFGDPDRAVYGWDLRSNGQQVRPCALWHGGHGALEDNFAQANGACASWDITARALLLLHRANLGAQPLTPSSGWNTGLAGTDAATGFHQFGGLPKVCSEVYEDPFTGLPLDPVNDGDVKARWALRDPALNANETAPLVEYEVLAGKHVWTQGDGLLPCYWDESLVATSFFRRNGLGGP